MADDCGCGNTNMNILNRNNQLLPKNNQFVNQPVNNQIHHINNQQKFNSMNNQNNQAVNVSNQNNQVGNVSNQTGMNNQNNQGGVNKQNIQGGMNNQNKQEVNNQSETKKGINLVLCILAALSIHEAAKYFINKSIRLNNGTSSRYLYYAVACIAAVILYNLILQ